MASGKLKKITYWGIAALAVGLASLSLVISFLDWNQYRETLSDIASRQMDMRIELAGNVSVALFPRPSVSAETVRIAPMGQANSNIIATADKILMRLGVASMLKGKVGIQRLVLEGLSLAVDETASGNWQVRGWPRGSGDTAIDLNRLDIENGHLNFTPFGGSERVVDGLNLHLTGKLPAGPLNWQGSLVLDGLHMQTEGRLKPVVGREETSIKVEVILDSSKISASGRLAENGDATARLLLEGNNLAEAYAGLSIVAGGGNKTPGELMLPHIPYALDLQLDINGGVGRIVSRQFTLANTRGRIDLTTASKANVNHIAGSLSLGVIDIDAWRATIPNVREEAVYHTSVDANGSRMSLSGALDVTIEGVRMNGGLGQRIDAAIAFTPSGPEITNLQALLPGATTLSVVGNLGVGQGNAVARIEVGSIADLARWVSVELPAAIPAGRLSTATAKAVFDYRDDVWALTNLDGFLDTSKIEGALSGDGQSLTPTHVKLAMDTLDLDIFRSAAGDDSEEPVVRVPEGLDIGLDISVASLHGFDTALGTARFVGALQNGQLDVDFLSFENNGGSLRIEGSLDNDKDDVALELTADFHQWEMQVSRFFVPVLHEYLLATAMEKLDGTASVAGAFSRMRLGFDAVMQGREISLSGEIGFPQNRLTFVNLQGALKHDNLAGAARLAGYGNFKKLPAQVTYSLSKAATGDPFMAKIGGDLAGGKMQADISHFDGFEGFSFSFDHENVGQLVAETGVILAGLDRTESVRAELAFAREDAGWAITIPNIKNGSRALSGSLNVTDENQFSGILNVSAINLTAGTGSLSAARDDNLRGKQLHALANYAGTISLILNNVQVAGQRLSAQAAKLAVGDGTARLSLGAGATMNGEAVTLDMDAVLEAEIPFTTRADFSALELAPLLASEGIGDLVTSSMAGELTLKGSLASSHGFWAGLSGGGHFEGTAGQLKFLSVAGLVNQIRSAQSGRSFLANVGGFLRRGETPFGTLNSRFSIDGGVMLVETVTATGEWGALSLDGQVNLSDRFLALKGELVLSNPVDTPPIPVNFEGPFDGPKADWSSRLFERFVIAGIEQRLRATLFRDMETRQAESGQVGQNPGLAVFSRAFGLLTKLKADQTEKKRLEEEARQRAVEAKKVADSMPQVSEEQRP